MNKGELVELMATKADTTQKAATGLLNAFIDSITQTARSGEKVTLVGFSTFDSRERKARQGRNPKTSETIDIPAAVVPIFSPGKEFKEAMK
ncbi:HU family DNA-binding protein [Microcoleus sp. herbarium14]|uniref:HU family DNA-binding protein n=1 Tax=Microcoleus sp. herbarium14 TaxID=3055439 RepID=UPI002FD4A5A9